ncbi:MAG: GvpL/GvpF family gas vesicle protein [Verrucomicrobia bacterium]|nr:GvpL/GvpF family gas vesicle protein [Verrucomicrobiota bacterium]MCF7707513.1 GvpL/GvpF family gas vesicle protein [Verrucomicrobiota bacterium]
MNLIYLYCIRDLVKAHEAIDAIGVDENEGVFSYPFRGLEAVISEVSENEFGTEEIQRKAKEDVDWIKSKVLRHHEVIQKSTKKGSSDVCVVPMSFGTIFKSTANLEQILSRNYGNLSRLLEKFRGKQELSVKAFLVNRDTLDDVICEHNPEIAAEKVKIANQPEGLAFFLEQDFKKVIDRERDREIERISKDIFRRMEDAASDSRRMEVLDKHIVGRSEPMVFNAAYLVENNELNAFLDIIRELNEKLGIMGLSLECAGPLAPFSFSALGDINE